MSKFMPFVSSGVLFEGAFFPLNILKDAKKSKKIGNLPPETRPGFSSGAWSIGRDSLLQILVRWGGGQRKGERGTKFFPLDAEDILRFP